MTQNDQSTGISRRTVTKAMAWAVPTIAVASTVPLAAASVIEPPPPSFDWANGCATVGNTNHGCAKQDKTPQVPIVVKNPTGVDLQLQVIGTKSWIDGESEPAGWSQPTGVYLNSGSEDNCGSRIDFASSCGGYRSITVNAGAEMHIWFVGAQLSNSSAFWMAVQYRWVDPVTCEVAGDVNEARPDVIVPSNNCGQ